MLTISVTMANLIETAYREAEILGADSLKLVQMLYPGAIDSIGAARRHLQAGNIAGRSRAIMRAWNIVNELRQSLNHSVGGEISRNLGGLYAYMQRRLLEANSKQIEAPLAEVERLLSTLLGAWEQAAAQTAERQDETPSASTAEHVPISCAY